MAWLERYYGDGPSRAEGLAGDRARAVSILDLTYPSIPGISLLRLARILRVLRIFNRLRSLRAIINALTASMLPVGNAFCVMALVTSVYSIVGSQLYGDADPSTFGDFSTALFTVTGFAGSGPLRVWPGVDPRRARGRRCSR